MVRDASVIEASRIPHRPTPRSDPTRPTRPEGIMAPSPTRAVRTMRKVAAGTAGIVGFLVVWQLIPALGIMDPQLPAVRDRHPGPPG